MYMYREMTILKRPWKNIPMNIFSSFLSLQQSNIRDYYPQGAGFAWRTTKEQFCLISWIFNLLRGYFSLQKGLDLNNCAL